MSTQPIKRDDEIQHIITRVFHETGYRLDRRDPVIVQFVAQGILLNDFNEAQQRLFHQLSERLIPAINAETKKLEEQKDRLWDLARSTASEVVRKVGSEYTQQIRDAMRQTDNAMLENLNDHIKRLRGEQNSLLSEMREEHQHFHKTAKQFEKIVLWFLFGGSAIIVSAVVFLGLRYG